MQLDVGDDNSTQQAISFIAKKEGQINLLVNNAGYTQLGAIEDLTLEEVASQFNTNVFGDFRTIKQVAPIMRKQHQQSTTAGGGCTIINIGSANGFFGVPCASAYVATKFALEGVTQSLRYELAPFGIKVSIIEPGAVKTDVATRNMFFPKKITEKQPQPPSSLLQEEEKSKDNDILVISSPFTEMTKTIMEKSEAAVANGSHPKLIAEMVVRIYKTEKPEWRYLAGNDSEKLFEARRQMSDTEFENRITCTIELMIN